MKHFYTVIITVILFLPLHSFAETKDSILSQSKEIISEGTYNMGDGETPGVAESRALLQAKRTALEQAGTYVESYTKVKNLQLTEDEIKVLSSGLMEVEIINKKRTIVREGEGIHFWVKIKAIVNLDKTEEMAKRVKEKSVVEDYKKIQEAYDKSQKDIEELKKQLAQAKGEKEKKQVEAKITDEERLFQAKEWFEKGNNYYHINKEYDNAIEAYTKAIVLNPNNASAYINRGNVYAEKGQQDKAIEDYNKAIAITPNDDYAYFIRGNAYVKKGQYDKAIKDYNRAIELEPLKPSFFSGESLPIYYSFRGNAYAKKGQYDKAIEDYNKAIAINPNDTDAYTGRGIAYVYKGQYDRAIADYNKAIELSPKDTNALSNRGLVYAKLGNNGNALKDLNKALELDPDKTYYNMSCFYSIQKNADKACYYLEKSIEKDKNWDWIRKDKDLDNIRSAECYKRIMKGK